MTIADIISKIQEDSERLERKQVTCDPGIVLDAMRKIGTELEPRFVTDKQNLDFFLNLAYWFMADPRMKAIHPATRQAIAGRVNKGLYIAGRTGSGKTLATKILGKLYAANPFLGKAREGRDNGISMTGRVVWREMRADEITDKFAQTGDISREKQSMLLCIQDLGSEPVETLYMGNRVPVIRQLLEHRGDNPDCITIITSNIPLGDEDLRKRYGERVVSRLFEMCNYITLDGTDRRKNY